MKRCTDEWIMNAKFSTEKQFIKQFTAAGRNVVITFGIRKTDRGHFVWPGKDKDRDLKKSKDRDDEGEIAFHFSGNFVCKDLVVCKDRNIEGRPMRYEPNMLLITHVIAQRCNYWDHAHVSFSVTNITTSATQLSLENINR